MLNYLISHYSQLSRDTKKLVRNISYWEYVYWAAKKGTWAAKWGVWAANFGQLFNAKWAAKRAFGQLKRASGQLNVAVGQLNSINYPFC